MGHRFAEIAFTETVRAEQERQGSRVAYERMENADAPYNHILSDREAAFITSRDSFYMGSVSETGWPYIQHRGGPLGFLKVLDESTLGFADYRGNRQYVTVGNLKTEDRVSLFLMDYPNRARLKLLGHARTTEDPDILEKLAVEGYKAKVERGVLIDVAAFDWNCPQHITPRFTQADIANAVAPLHERIADLEAALAAASGK